MPLVLQILVAIHFAVGIVGTIMGIRYTINDDDELYDRIPKARFLVMLIVALIFLSMWELAVVLVLFSVVTRKLGLGD